MKPIKFPYVIGRPTKVKDTKYFRWFISEGKPRLWIFARKNNTLPVKEDTLFRHRAGLGFSGYEVKCKSKKGDIWIYFNATIARQIIKYLVPVTEDIYYDYSKIDFKNIIIPHNERY